jgi:spermidine synthase
MNIKKMLSYFMPIKIHQRESKVNTTLEITWNNGHLVLDSKNTNYSYGSLQKVLRKGLETIGFESIRNSNHILVLGVAGGSVIKTLVEEIQYNGKITGVEIDSDTIVLANHYFGLDKIKNTAIIIDDAQNFVDKTNLKFDIIIIDIFQDLVMPTFLFENQFIENTEKCLVDDGFILFNTIVSNPTAHIRNENFIQLVQSKNRNVQRISKVEGDNELLIINTVK